jgi:hypothetical protein
MDATFYSLILCMVWAIHNGGRCTYCGVVETVHFVWRGGAGAEARDRSELRLARAFGFCILLFLCLALLFVAVLRNWTARVDRTVQNTSGFVVLVGIRKELFPVFDRL